MKTPCLTFFTRPGCGLCVTAWAVVEAARARVAFAIEVVDIEQNPDWFTEYKWDIPVVHIDDEFAFKHTLELEALVAALERAAAE